MMNVIGSQLERDTATYKALGRMMTDDNLHFIHDIRNQIAVMTDPDFDPDDRFSEILDLNTQQVEEIPSEFLRGIALGIATSLEADIRGATAPPVGRMHREMVTMYEAIQAILIERGAHA